ncbi:MAG: hypothetical protein EOO88_59780 [Pedobacter sp.]|nr:MAG: hypothetical protein EOO88_59780 [Pedobacter sp.]
MLKKSTLLFCFLFALLNLIADYSGAQRINDQQKGLKDYYKNFFPIGVAVTPQQLKDSAQRQLILKHFNSVTAENAMKMGPIHPRENEYYWKNSCSK